MLKEREEQVKAKRKREADGDAYAGSEEVQANGKKRKIEAADDDEEAKRRQKAEKRKEKRLKKREKSEKNKAKAEAKKAKKQGDDLAEAQAMITPLETVNADLHEDDSGDEAEPVAHPADMEDLDMSGLAEPDEQEAVDEVDQNASEHSSAPTTPIIESPAFDIATNHSTASSSSSISLHSMTDQAPAPPEQRRPQLSLATDPPKIATDSATAPADAPSTSRPRDITSGTSSPKLQLPNIDAEELRARFNKRYQELRAARKADGPDGNPIKSRQDIMEQRRKKAEQRKATKKALRQKAKEEEARKREEQLRGSGSPLSKVGDVFSPPPPRQNSYSFSRLSFGDSASESATLDSLNESSNTSSKKKQKGPSDPKTALQAAQARDAKLANLPAHKQALQSQKNMWGNAASRAYGDRPRDDTSLLKKALKRKEKQKGKSEREWKEREQGVIKAREAGQQKRERNLQKRREEKGGKGKGGKKKGGKGGGVKQKGRPGFEGRWKA